MKTDKELLNEDAWNIRYVDQTDENVKYAIRVCESALLCVEQTEGLCLWVVGVHGWAIKYIENPSEEVQLLALKGDFAAIKHISNPSEKVQLAAVRGSVWAMLFIRDPSKKVIAAANKAKGL